LNLDTVTAIIVPEDKMHALSSARFLANTYFLGAGLSGTCRQSIPFGHVGDMNDVSMLGAIAGC